MDWVYYSLLIVFLLTGFVLNIVTLPGNWLALLTTWLYAWLTGWQFIGWVTLVVLLILASIAEIVELLAAGRSASKAGGSRLGGIGALLGAVLGGIFLTTSIPIPVIGTLLGILIGTFLGSAIVEFLLGKPLTTSALIGGHAAKGRLYGTMLKVAVGLVMSVLTLVLGFPWRW